MWLHHSSVKVGKSVIALICCALPYTQITQTLSRGAPGEPGLPVVEPAMVVLAIGPAPVREATPAQEATSINNNATLISAPVSSGVTFQMLHETK